MADTRQNTAWTQEDLDLLWSIVPKTGGRPSQALVAKAAKALYRTPGSVKERIRKETISLRLANRKPGPEQERLELIDAREAEELKNYLGLEKPSLAVPRPGGMTILVSCRCRKCGEVNEIETTFNL